MANQIKTQTSSTAVSHPKRKDLKEVLKPYVTYRTLLIMLIPALIYYAVFHYKSMYGLIIAFKDYRLLDGIWNSPWVGLKHFKMAFSSTEFIRAWELLLCSI